jgi:hypothetical protein
MNLSLRGSAYVLNLSPKDWLDEAHKDRVYDCSGSPTLPGALFFMHKTREASFYKVARIG